jgi:D-3-phosphoglycerate dehydrogenase
MPESPVVVVADPIDRSALERLRGGPCRVVDASAEPGQLAAHLADAWGIVVRSRTKVNAELLRAAPGLQLIARAGVGVDNVDMKLAGERGIRVVNAPAAATASVAELSVALYLLLVRGLYPSIVSTKGGKWERSGHGREISGKTVGFVGYGRIAREVARRLEPFGTSTIAYDPFVKESGDRTAIVAWEELLARSDIVSVHAALTAENKHLLDGRAFAAMKPGAFLVNVARGPLVDEAALLSSLKSGRLAGAALDVFEVEPPMNRELLEMPNLIATPHIGAMTSEGQGRAGTEIVDEVLRALRGEELHSVVAPPGGPK